MLKTFKFTHKNTDTWSKQMAIKLLDEYPDKYCLHRLKI